VRAQQPTQRAESRAPGGRTRRRIPHAAIVAHHPAAAGAGQRPGRDSASTGNSRCATRTPATVRTTESSDAARKRIVSRTPFRSGFSLRDKVPPVVRRLTDRATTVAAVSIGGPARVTLVEVDETVLAELVRVATTDASANDVTPPLTDGDCWTEARVVWLRNFHRDRRAGLDGPERESTWAVAAFNRVVGSVRLARTESIDVMETGIWLARHVRGQGIGSEAVTAVVQLATALGAATVRADTTSTNVQALAVLKRAGFRLSATSSCSAS
jgi:RimJ/RimL family protein N-acetyltransferase